MILPIISVQHDFQTVISDVNDGTIEEEDFWVSCYKTGESSVHGKVRVSLGESGDNGQRDVQFASRDGVVFDQESRVRCPYFSRTFCTDALSGPLLRYLSLAFNSQNAPAGPETFDQRHGQCEALAHPSDAFLLILSTKPRQITAVSIAPDLSQIAVGHADGTIRRLANRTTSNAIQPLTCTPHLSGTSITSLRYFPSSRVLLSGGTDLALHVLDADPALEQTPSLTPVRSLKGHIRTVTDTAIVARGRNVLSSAKDGTMRLWDVGSGSQIRVMGAQKYAGINALSLGETPAGWISTLDVPQPDTREVEIADKLVFVGLQDGHFECFDLAAKASAFHSSSSQDYKTNGALTAISFSSNARLVSTGSTKGVVVVFDTRNLHAPLCSFQRNDASIEGLAFTSLGSLAIVTEDGLPYVAGIQQGRPEVLAELTAGADCEATRVVDVDASGGIWVAGDDGVVRMY